METILILFIALAIDLTLGEPPNALHPVAWMGKVASFLEKGSTSRSPAAQFVYGTLLTLATIALFAIPTYFLFTYLASFNSVAYVIIGAAIFKTTFSLRELRRVALGIKNFLTEAKLDKARFELRALVKRDTANLPEPLLVSATVESVAENASDSFVAPLFYFLLLGVPGAMAYRVVNTLDAMIGYHGQYEYLGKFAARLDTVLNFIPARLTALLLVLATSLSRRNGRASWQVTLSDHAKTESPNAGWPMAAVAGALNVQLEKVGHYKLGNGHGPLVPQTIDASLGLLQIAALVWVVLCAGVEVILFVAT